MIDYSQLTDLEICKRIAVIRGHKFIDGKPDIGYIDYLLDEEFNAIANPITDNTLLLELVYTHGVNISWDVHLNDNCTATIDRKVEDLPFPVAIADQNNASINKAVCLAIIEANDWIKENR